MLRSRYEINEMEKFFYFFFIWTIIRLYNYIRYLLTSFYDQIWEGMLNEELKVEEEETYLVDPKFKCRLRLI